MKAKSLDKIFGKYVYSGTHMPNTLSMNAVMDTCLLLEPTSFSMNVTTTTTKEKAEIATNNYGGFVPFPNPLGEAIHN